MKFKKKKKVEVAKDPFDSRDDFCSFVHNPENINNEAMQEVLIYLYDQIKK